jgi:hypothetical protein
VAATVSWDGLRELARFRAEKGCAISVYVDLDPSEAPTAGDAATRINSLLHEGHERAESASELSHDQREALRSDLARLRAFFDNEFDTGVLMPGQSATHVFETPGTYFYNDAVYPQNTGKIVVY